MFRSILTYLKQENLLQSIALHLDSLLFKKEQGSVIAELIRLHLSLQPTLPEHCAGNWTAANKTLHCFSSSSTPLAYSQLCHIRPATFALCTHSGEPFIGVLPQQKVIVQWNVGRRHEPRPSQFRSAAGGDTQSASDGCGRPGQQGMCPCRPYSYPAQWDSAVWQAGCLHLGIWAGLLPRLLRLLCRCFDAVTAHRFLCSRFLRGLEHSNKNEGVNPSQPQRPLMANEAGRTSNACLNH